MGEITVPMRKAGINTIIGLQEENNKQKRLISFLEWLIVEGEIENHSKDHREELISQAYTMVELQQPEDEDQEPREYEVVD